MDVHCKSLLPYASILYSIYCYGKVVDLLKQIFVHWRPLLIYKGSLRSRGLFVRAPNISLLFFVSDRCANFPIDSPSSLIDSLQLVADFPMEG